jgi:Holliday junction DNA helicase RuvA
LIATIEGLIEFIGSDFLVVKVSGVGLRISVPTGLRNPSSQGQLIHLYTNLVVREDSLTLYGFETDQERVFFELLLSVNGIGPRTALSIISVLSVETIRRAVLGEQAEIFARVPGVGKKTAQKILLSLQGKVGSESGEISLVGVDTDTEILEALTSLGYSVVEAQAAIQSIPNETDGDLETRLRFALKYFNR